MNTLFFLILIVHRFEWKNMINTWMAAQISTPSSTSVAFWEASVSFLAISYCGQYFNSLHPTPWTNFHFYCSQIDCFKLTQVFQFGMEGVICRKDFWGVYGRGLGRLELGIHLDLLSMFGIHPKINDVHPNLIPKRDVVQFCPKLCDLNANIKKLYSIVFFKSSIMFLWNLVRLLSRNH